MSVVLGVDAGTTGVTVLAVDVDGQVVARGYREFPQHFPAPGYVEHDPAEIWAAVLDATAAALAAVGGPDAVRAVGVTNQRETAVLWRRADGSAPRPALVWQDRRTAAYCADLVAAGHEPRVRHLTGLRLDPYFTATKLAWVAEHEPGTWTQVTAGDVAVGTVDSYVVSRMTGGAHLTDPSNASRTLLYDLAAGDWSAELCGLFGVPVDALPTIVDSAGCCARTDPGAFLGLDVPISGIAGDQQAALFGQACFEPGQSKCTYGTGAFLLVCTGDVAVRAEGLLTSVGWRLGGRCTYVVEGSVFVTGAAVQWLRDGLGVIGSAAEVEALAASVPDAGGVVFVPALTGLGAPDWDPQARGLIIGLTRGSTAAHLARATLEAIAFGVRDIADVLPLPLRSLTVDGGAAANDLLCAEQADQLGVEVRRPQVLDTTALGAAFLAGLGSGVWPDLDALRGRWTLDRAFSPRGGRDDGRHSRWRQAVARSRGWGDAASFEP